MKKAQKAAKEIEFLRNKKDKTEDEKLKLMYLEEEFEKHYKWLIEAHNYIKENNSKLEGWSKELAKKKLGVIPKRNDDDDDYHY